MFPPRKNGLPAVAEPVVSESAGGVPFAIGFDETGKRMLVAEAEKSTVAIYKVKHDGTLEVLQGPLANGQEVLCGLARGQLLLRRQHRQLHRQRLPHGWSGRARPD
ncbi:hypothetical protein ABZ281_42300, partial [Streptomyces sp. NPDC006265]